MNKRVIIAGAIALAVTIVVVLNHTAVRTSPAVQQMAQTNTRAFMATSKAKAEQVSVKLVGLTTILNIKKAFLQVRWPADTSRREQSCMLSEGESQDGITVESIDATNGVVKLRVLQTTRIVRFDKSA
jgi:uncharacterized protein with FMN-binding domain